MKFRVYGLDRGTGEPRDVVIDAADESAARDAASRDAIIVERVLKEPAGQRSWGRPADPNSVPNRIARHLDWSEYVGYWGFRLYQYGAIFVGFFAILRRLQGSGDISLDVAHAAMLVSGFGAAICAHLIRQRATLREYGERLLNQDNHPT